MARLAVLGSGRIGGEIAYLAATLGIVDELVLHDTAPELLKAQVLDLRHTGLEITVSTDTALVKESDVCVFSAGLPRSPSVRTRADLLDANLPVLSDSSGLLTGFPGILITVTNPMDVNNFYLSRKTGIEPRRCIGFGGQLDSARFGLALQADGTGGIPWVLGEHGEHQVPVFSHLASLFSNSRREEILTGLRGSSMEIIRGKGGTVFGPVYHLAMLVKAVLADSRELLPCSCILDGEYGLPGCSLGVPARIGKDGIHSIEEWKLDAWEQEKMAAAGAFVRELCMRAVS